MSPGRPDPELPRAPCKENERNSVRLQNLGEVVLLRLANGERLVGWIRDEAPQGISVSLQSGFGGSIGEQVIVFVRDDRRTAIARHVSVDIYGNDVVELEWLQ